MFLFRLLFVLALLCGGRAMAQTSPNFLSGNTLPAGQLNSVLSGKVDTTNGVLTTPTINGGTLTGTFSGSPVFSGSPTIPGASVTSGLGYTPANRAGDALSGTFTGSPTFSGNPNFSGGATLTAPTINGGTLTGTFSGSIVTMAPGTGSDATAAIQTAAASITSGGVLELPSGNYVVSAPTALLSNTRVHCGTGAVITAAAAASWPGGAHQGSFISETTGTNFEVTGCRFSWASGDGSSHILSFSGATNVYVHGNISDGGGDFSADIGSTNVRETENTVTNISNSCFDHWGGFTVAHTNNNYCSTYASAGGGLGAIQFTGIATGGGQANSSVFEAIGNTVFVNNANSPQCIIVNGHASGGTDDGGKIIGNTCNITGGNFSWGILIQGHANNVEVASNICNNNGGSFGCVGAFTPASGINIHDNSAVSWVSNTTNGVFTSTATSGTLINNRNYGTSPTVGSNISPTIVRHGNTGQNGETDTQVSYALPGGYLAGRFYGAISSGGTPISSALTAANTLYATPFFVQSASTLKTLSFDIGTGNASAWNARMCVYYDNGAGMPGALVPNADSGTVAIASGSVIGVQTSPTLNSGTGVLLLGPQWYWLAFNGSATGESVFSASGSGQETQRFLGDSVATGIFAGVANNGVSGAQTFGACPATFPSPAVARSTGIPYVEAGF